MTDFPGHPEMLAREEAPQPFWVSWWGHNEAGFEYHGPWWISGYSSGCQNSYCAAVMATDEDAARKVIVTAYDADEPDIEWRFVEAREEDWSPYNGRFNSADWMCWPWPVTS